MEAKMFGKKETNPTDSASVAQSPSGANEKTTKKAKKEKSGKKNRFLVYGVCIGASVLSIAVVVWAVITFMNKPPIDEDFFVSDATKTTVSLTPTGSDPDSTLRQTHVVYEYDGDLVVGMKTYFEYPDAESAAAAYETAQNQPEFKNSELSGNYIIVTADPKQFEGLTASDIRQQAAAIEAYQAQKRAEEEAAKAAEEPKEAEPQPEPQPEEAPAEVGE